MQAQRTEDAKNIMSREPGPLPQSVWITINIIYILYVCVDIEKRTTRNIGDIFMYCNVLYICILTSNNRKVHMCACIYIYQCLSIVLSTSHLLYSQVKFPCATDVVLAEVVT